MARKKQQLTDTEATNSPVSEMDVSRASENLEPMISEPAQSEPEAAVLTELAAPSQALPDTPVQDNDDTLEALAPSADIPHEEDIEEELRTIPLVPPDDKLPTVPQLVVAIVLLVVVLGYPTILQFMGQPARAKDTAPLPPAPLQQAAPEPAPAPEKKDYFDGITLEAKAAYVWDVKEQRALYTKNASDQLPLASLTKLMTALVAFETYGPETEVPITLGAISQEGENGFHDGEKWRLKDLLDYTLMTSSNDGAYALAAVGAGGNDDSDFLSRMNRKAREIGLTQTYFTNPTGLDTSETESGSYGSARDMAFLMEYILEHAPNILAKTTEPSAVFADASGTPFIATNTNDHISAIDDALASKTGYTVLAGGNLVVAFSIKDEHPIVVTVLGSSREGRFSDVEMLRERVIASFEETAP